MFKLLQVLQVLEVSKFRNQRPRQASISKIPVQANKDQQSQNNTIKFDLWNHKILNIIQYCKRNEVVAFLKTYQRQLNVG